MNAAAASAMCFVAVPAIAASTAQCEVKGSFEGTNLPGATASGRASVGSQLALDLFGANPSHELLITITPAGTGATLTIVLTDKKLESDVFLETTLGSTVLGITVEGTYNGARMDDISLLCRAEP